PTFLPGRHFVPCWRMMIVPPRTCSPPKRLTPRRWALLSRPLRLLPCTFLCAMHEPHKKIGAAPAPEGHGCRSVRLRCDSGVNTVDPHRGVRLAVSPGAP